ncbi:hypothetical protein [Rhizobium leguminosarum]|uniref:hypothetical protein n=1 Tax=Rhizobium leguminosarum TaxID=384 RepID=UPI001C962B19|nr:hypothetical protein [Rhizobium leguminosarum]MBY5653792.1 hypothetical protein [Rhizobium leguminosarum]
MQFVVPIIIATASQVDYVDAPVVGRDLVERLIHSIHKCPNDVDAYPQARVVSSQRKGGAKPAATRARYGVIVAVHENMGLGGPQIDRLDQPQVSGTDSGEYSINFSIVQTVPRIADVVHKGLKEFRKFTAAQEIVATAGQNQKIENAALDRNSQSFVTLTRIAGKRFGDDILECVPRPSNIIYIKSDIFINVI